MSILGIGEKQHGSVARTRAGQLNSTRRVWTPWLLLAFIPLPLVCASPDMAPAGGSLPYEMTQQRGENSLPAVSRSSLETQIGQFHDDYARLSQLSAATKYSRYRMQLQSFLAQAKQLEAHAQANYQADLSRNSQDPQEPAVELAMVVDVVASVTRELESAQTPASNARLVNQTRAWFKRLRIGLEQYKDALDLYDSGREHASPGMESLNNPYTLYSKASTSLARARTQLSAGDSLGAWLSIAQCNMLVGNLAMRLETSTYK